MAFVYESKAAEEAIRVGSFGDGLLFLECALSLAECDEDFDMLFSILSPDLMEFLSSNDVPSSLSAESSSSQQSSTHLRFVLFESKNNSLRMEYAKMKLRAEKKQKEMRRNHHNHSSGSSYLLRGAEGVASQQSNMSRYYLWRTKSVQRSGSTASTVQGKENYNSSSTSNDGIENFRSRSESHVACCIIT